MLGPGTVAAVGDIERGLAVVATLPEIGNVRPSDGDSAGARGERRGRWHQGEERREEVIVDLRIR